MRKREHRPLFYCWMLVAVAAASKNGIRRLIFRFWENDLHMFTASSLPVLCKFVVSSLQIPCTLLAGFLLQKFLARSLLEFCIVSGGWRFVRVWLIALCVVSYHCCGSVAFLGCAVQCAHCSAFVRYSALVQYAHCFAFVWYPATVWGLLCFLGVRYYTEAASGNSSPMCGILPCVVCSLLRLRAVFCQSAVCSLLRLHAIFCLGAVWLIAPPLCDILACGRDLLCFPCRRKRGDYAGKTPFCEFFEKKNIESISNSIQIC